MSATSPYIVVEGDVPLHACYEEELRDYQHVVQKNYYVQFDPDTDSFHTLVARFDYSYEEDRLREIRYRLFSSAQEVMYEEREVFYVGSSRKTRIRNGVEEVF